MSSVLRFNAIAKALKKMQELRSPPTPALKPRRILLENLEFVRELSLDELTPDKPRIGRYYELHIVSNNRLTGKEEDGPISKLMTEVAKQNSY